MNQDLGTQILNFLRDPIWQSVGVFAGILIALVPAFRISKLSLSLSNIKKVLWVNAVPLLAACGIVTILWRQIELSIIINMILITIYFVKERESSQERVKNNENETKPKKAIPSIDNPHFTKPPKR